jgi:glycosyltransferase involved in cell wall biosynthesis
LGAFGGQGQHGFELLIDALPLVLNRIPDIRVTVISYEIIPESLRKRISDLRLELHFEILGYIKDNEDLGKILMKRKIGLALYPENFKVYNDIARPKTLLSKGLPVIITTSPVLAKDIKDKNAGIVIRFDKDELCSAIIRLFEDKKFFEQCRTNAIALASKYSAQVIFEETFKQMAAA